MSGECFIDQSIDNEKAKFIVLHSQGFESDEAIMLVYAQAGRLFRIRFKVKDLQDTLDFLKEKPKLA